MNPDEVFSCNDLTDDYKICRREKRMQTSATGRRVNCTDYRKLGKLSLHWELEQKYHSHLSSKSWFNFLLFIANACYYMEEGEFVDHILERYQEKRRYADFLE